MKSAASVLPCSLATRSSQPDLRLSAALRQRQHRRNREIAGRVHDERKDISEPDLSGLLWSDERDREP